MESYETLNVPGPIITAITRPFWDATKRGELLLPFCDDCGQFFFYPRLHCPHCWSNRVGWKRGSGRGAVKSFSRIHRAGHFAWQSVTPYTLLLVRLEEGPTMLSQLASTPGVALAIGDPLRLRCVTVGKFTLPFFELDKSAG